MLEIWKEFFRLKGEEISEWWECIEWDEVFGTIYLVIVACSIVFLIGHLILIAINHFTFNPYGVDDTFCIGMIVVVLTVFMCMLFYYVIIKPIKWLLSNWKQAKKNVSERCV